MNRKELLLSLALHLEAYGKKGLNNFDIFSMFAKEEQG